MVLLRQLLLDLQELPPYRMELESSSGAGADLLPICASRTTQEASLVATCPHYCRGISRQSPLSQSISFHPRFNALSKHQQAVTVDDVALRTFASTPFEPPHPVLLYLCLCTVTHFGKNSLIPVLYVCTRVPNQYVHM